MLPALGPNFGPSWQSMLQQQPAAEFVGLHGFDLDQLCPGSIPGVAGDRREIGQVRWNCECGSLLGGCWVVLGGAEGLLLGCTGVTQ